MSKLKFQSKTIYTKTCVQNIVNCYLKGDVNNSTWYHDANTFCRILKSKSEHDYNKSISLESVCAVVSALSPQKSWEENKRIAENFILNDLFKGNTSSSINKAIRCLNSNDVYEHLNILNGEKTKAFYLNILYPKKITGATVDRHALEVALNKKLNNHSITVKQYQFFSRCYFLAADLLSILPHELQAVTWEYWRKYKKTLN